MTDRQTTLDEFYILGTPHKHQIVIYKKAYKYEGEWIDMVVYVNDLNRDEIRHEN